MTAATAAKKAPARKSAARSTAAPAKSQPKKTAPAAEPEAVESVEDGDFIAEPKSDPFVVNGLVVVRDEPVQSNLPAVDGKHRQAWKGLRKLTLEDGSTTYKCADCDETGTRGYLHAQHRPDAHGNGPVGRRKGRDNNILSDTVLAMSLGELFELANASEEWGTMFERLTESRDAWKARALTAEADLKKFEAVIGKLGYEKKEED